MKRKRREGCRTLYTYSDWGQSLNWFHFKRGGRKRKLAHQKWTPLLFRLAVCDTQIDGPFDISMARVENFNLPLSRIRDFALGRQGTGNSWTHSNIVFPDLFLSQSWQDNLDTLYLKNVHAEFWFIVRKNLRTIENYVKTRTGHVADTLARFWSVAWLHERRRKGWM